MATRGMDTIRDRGLFALVFASVFVQAQPVRVSVYEGGEDASTVPQAMVVVNDTAVGVTDRDGVFLWNTAVQGDRIKALFVGSQSEEFTYRGEGEIVLRLNASTVLNAVEVVEAVEAVRIDAKALDFRQQINAKELRRAACCNLSESFENNPSIDVSITDAVTGTRELELLGLSGRFMQTQLDLLPLFRGLSLKRGFAQIPGVWVSSMQLSKGAGSVVYGHESTTGQLNIELLDPETAEGSRVNIYANQTGRTEFNATTFFPVDAHWKTGFLVHGSNNPKAIDRNGDRFADQGSGHLVHVLNRWNYNNGSWEAKLMLRALQDVQQGGQSDYDFDQSESVQVLWGLERKQQLLGFSGKLGYLFPESDRTERSIGLMLSGTQTQQWAFAGHNRVDAKQGAYYANLIYASADLQSKMDWRLGGTATVDRWDLHHRMDSVDYAGLRTETDWGVFGEWGWNPNETFGLLLGLRADQHRFLGTRLSPRIHLRYAVSDSSWIRLSAGRGWRAAQPWVEQFELLASARSVRWDEPGLTPTAPSQAESAWNVGGSWVRDFALDFRKATLTLDVFGTWFDAMVWADREVAPDALHLRNLGGAGNLSALFQVEWQIKRRMDIRLAYKYTEPWIERPEGRVQTPFVSRHRALMGWFYETRNRWGFDAALQWRGAQRVVTSNPVEFNAFSPGFVVFNAQVKKQWGDRWETYIGAENLFDFVQNDPIVAPENPYEPGFDATLIWGPVMGRIVFVGVNYQLELDRNRAD